MPFTGCQTTAYCSVLRHIDTGLFYSVPKYVNESIPDSSTEMGLCSSQIQWTMMLTRIDLGDIDVIKTGCFLCPLNRRQKQSVQKAEAVTNACISPFAFYTTVTVNWSCGLATHTQKTPKSSSASLTSDWPTSA